MMTTEQQLTALRLLKTAARGHPYIPNADIREINRFLCEIEKEKQELEKEVSHDSIINRQGFV